MGRSTHAQPQHSALNIKETSKFATLGDHHFSTHDWVAGQFAGPKRAVLGHKMLSLCAQPRVYC